jgi:predicted ATP-grasp superfamily ATP-dependent carboligase
MPTPVVYVLTHESNPDRQQKTTSFIALAITRSLGRRGIRVVRIHPNRLDRSLGSRYCSKVEICPDFYSSEEALVAFLLQLSARCAPQPRVLVPASDDCAYFLAKHRHRLEADYRIIGPPWSVMERLIDKRLQYESAQQLGVPIPETYFPASVHEVERIVPSLANYPYVIKPLVAHQWRRASMSGVSKGKKGFQVNTAAQLIERYSQIATADSNVMIQEVIGGRDDRLFTFLAYVNEQSVPVAYCIRKKIRQSPIDFGYCTLTVSCEDETVERQSIRLLQGIGFQGICGVEWKLDPRTSRYKLIEINGRAVNTTAISTACGVDIPYIAVTNDVPRVRGNGPRWRSGVKWINMAQDVWAAKELHDAGRLGWSDYLQSIRGKRVHAVFAPDDLRPFLGYFGEFLGSAIRGPLRR